MPSEEEAALLAQIASLSGAISQHKSSADVSPQQWQSTSSFRGRGNPSRGATWTDSRGHGRGGRGRGRGAWSSAQGETEASSSGAGARNRVLKLNGDRRSAASPSDFESSTVDTSSSGWVARKTNKSMTLMSSEIFKRNEASRALALASRAAGGPSRGTTSATRSRGRGGRPKPTAAVRRGDKMGEVVIDGVIFAFDETGSKLVKKSDPPREDGVEEISNHSDAKSSSTPLRMSIDGEAYVRTKTGNLIRQSIVTERESRRKEKNNLERKKRAEELGKQIGDRQKARYASQNTRSGNVSLTIKKSKRTDTPDGLCPFFCRTGRCKRGLQCPYKHDPSRVALCLGALRPSGCTRPPGTCLLSHVADATRTPHCTRFLAGSCMRGASCPYAAGHIEGVRADADICPAFAELGSCSKAEKCQMRHSYECPEYAKTGKCSKIGCKMQHPVEAGPKPGTSLPRQKRSSDNQIAGAQNEDEAKQIITEESWEVESESDWADGALFLRDDAAAEDSASSESEAEDHHQLPRELSPFLKGRKRYLDVASEVAEHASDDAWNRSASKRRKGKDFSAQEDFISLASLGREEGALDGGSDEDEVSSVASDDSQAEESAGEGSEELSVEGEEQGSDAETGDHVFTPH